MQQPIRAIPFGLLILIPVFLSVTYQELSFSTQLFT